MAIKVFIRRTCSPEKQRELQKHIREIRSLVPQQAGYISSEYLKTIDDTDEVVTISSWFSFEDWQAWFNSEDRKAIEEQINAIGGIETEYRIYRYIKTR